MHQNNDILATDQHLLMFHITSVIESRAGPAGTGRAGRSMLGEGHQDNGRRRDEIYLLPKCIPHQKEGKRW